MPISRRARNLSPRTSGYVEEFAQVIAQFGYGELDVAEIVRECSHDKTRIRARVNELVENSLDGCQDSAWQSAAPRKSTAYHTIKPRNSNRNAQRKSPSDHQPNKLDKKNSPQQEEDHKSAAKARSSKSPKSTPQSRPFTAPNPSSEQPHNPAPLNTNSNQSTKQKPAEEPQSQTADSAASLPPKVADSSVVPPLPKKQAPIPTKLTWAAKIQGKVAPPVNVQDEVLSRDPVRKDTIKAHLSSEQESGAESALQPPVLPPAPPLAAARRSWKDMVKGSPPTTADEKPKAKESSPTDLKAPIDQQSAAAAVATEVEESVAPPAHEEKIKEKSAAVAPVPNAGQVNEQEEVQEESGGGHGNSKAASGGHSNVAARRPPRTERQQHMGKHHNGRRQQQLEREEGNDKQGLVVQNGGKTASQSSEKWASALNNEGYTMPKKMVPMVPRNVSGQVVVHANSKTGSRNIHTILPSPHKGTAAAVRQQQQRFDQQEAAAAGPMQPPSQTVNINASAGPSSSSYAVYNPERGRVEWRMSPMGSQFGTIPSRNEMDLGVPRGDSRGSELKAGGLNSHRDFEAPPTTLNGDDGKGGALQAEYYGGGVGGTESAYHHHPQMPEHYSCAVPGHFGPPAGYATFGTLGTNSHFGGGNGQGAGSGAGHHQYAMHHYGGGNGHYLEGRGGNVSGYGGEAAVTHPPPPPPHQYGTNSHGHQYGNMYMTSPESYSYYQQLMLRKGASALGHHPGYQSAYPGYPAPPPPHSELSMGGFGGNKQRLGPSPPAPSGYGEQYAAPLEPYQMPPEVSSSKAGDFGYDTQQELLYTKDEVLATSGVRNPLYGGGPVTGTSASGAVYRVSGLEGNLHHHQQQLRNDGGVPAAYNGDEQLYRDRPHFDWRR